MTNDKEVFDQSYTEYWRTAVNLSVDGLPIPTENDASFYMNYLGVKDIKHCLDLGCGEGRMLQVLSSICDRVSGVDVEEFAIKLASNREYSAVKVGSGEKIPYQDEAFDFIFSWGVFDTLDLNAVLPELNRVATKWVLFSGKSNQFFEDDQAAINAERAAFLKGHPNKFVDLALLKTYVVNFGFKIERLLVFRRRGDFGKRIFQDASVGDICDLRAYEFLVLLQKTGSPKNSANVTQLWLPNSVTASHLANKNGYTDCKIYFSDDWPQQ